MTDIVAVAIARLRDTFKGTAGMVYDLIAAYEAERKLRMSLEAEIVIDDKEVESAVARAERAEQERDKNYREADRLAKALADEADARVRVEKRLADVQDHELVDVRADLIEARKHIEALVSHEGEESVCAECYECSEMHHIIAAARAFLASMEPK